MSAAGLLNHKAAEVLLNVFGAVFVFVAHVRNWGICKACSLCEPKAENQKM
jgi:hypothetical protein